MAIQPFVSIELSGILWLGSKLLTLQSGTSEPWTWSNPLQFHYPHLQWPVNQENVPGSPLRPQAEQLAASMPPPGRDLSNRDRGIGGGRPSW